MTVVATENAGEVAQSENKAVRAEAVLAASDEEHSRYVKQYEAGDKQAALANISALQQRISSVNATINDVRLAKKSEGLALESSEMAAADQSPAAKADYLKSSKQRFYYAQKGKQSFSMLRNGDDGYQVKQLQQKLKDQNLYSGTVDGEFSPEVEKAVEEYQKQNNIPADGVAGPATLKKLDMY
jgi:murein L,D-transpeptidase YcbB/YkuD